MESHENSQGKREGSTQLPSNTGTGNGVSLSLKDFLNYTYLSCTSDTTLYQKLHWMTHQLPLTVKELHELPVEPTQQMLAECFAKKGAFTPYYPDCVVSDLKHNFIQLMWSRLQKHSFGLVDHTGRVVGVATNADAVDLLDLHKDTSFYEHHFVAQIHMYLENLVTKVEDRLPDQTKLERGILLDMYMFGIPLNALTPSENLYVMYRLVKETHDRAERQGFQLSLAQNSHPYTQQLAQFFVCDRLLTDHPHSYVNSKGEIPFQSIPAKIAVTVDLKTYSRKSLVDSC